MRIIMLRPFIPRIVRSLPLGWRNALVDWMPIPALREMREIVGTLDSSRSFSTVGCQSSIHPSET